MLVPTAPAAAMPASGAPLPREPQPLAADLARTTRALRQEVERWRASAEPRPPRSVTLLALRQQRIYLRLGLDRPLARRVLARVPRAVAAEARDVVAARHALVGLGTPIPRRIRTGPALPARTLLAFYAEAERRFGVPWSVLAAVNFVETAFGKVKSPSASGAQGPMQFLPATWRAYGLGGDVNDPRDAILGAANYLRASGAPRDLYRALYAYNHSTAYVRAILRYAAAMRRDRRVYFAFHSWQVFVRTGSGYRQLTGPGRG